jgi:quercetin dioxygenase-like cupin family protein
MEQTLTNVRRALGAGVTGLCVIAAAAAALRAQPSPSAPPAAPARSGVVFKHALPPMDGAKLGVTLVQVTYGPGQSSQPHSHPCPVVGYVISGAVRMQVKGEAEQVYTPGQSFYEDPNGVHQVSANASQTEPATFLAFFTCDRETPLTVPPPAPK